ncbi:MAG TPA: ABC transporter ATP-binding protein [Sulfolobales archaeon]|nr:ABC transporter ATP-binding protein [Sulfolobales archaeon]
MSNTFSEKHILKVSDLQVRFYTYAGVVEAVSGVSFEVYRNEIVALVGETGSGKTMSTRAITRLIEPPGRIEGGSALFRRKNGAVVDLLKLSDEEIRKIRGDEIAYVFQDPTSALDPLYTIGAHIAETVKDHKKAGKNVIKELAIKLLRDVNIPNPEVRVKSFPHEMSGGMRQRAVTAISLSNSPALLIADEPTTNLDVTIQAQVLDMLKELARSRGMSTILVTHNLGVVAETADRVYVMYAGKIVENAGVYEIFDNPSHPYTQMLLRAVPNPVKKVEKLESIPGTIPTLINPPKGCRFHPRCPLAMDICRREEPPSIELSPGHTVRCWVYAKR